MSGGQMPEDSARSGATGQQLEWLHELMMASWRGDIEAVRVSLDAGVDVSIFDFAFVAGHEYRSAPAGKLNAAWRADLQRGLALLFVRVWLVGTMDAPDGSSWLFENRLLAKEFVNNRRALGFAGGKTTLRQRVVARLQNGGAAPYPEDEFLDYVYDNLDSDLPWEFSLDARIEELEIEAAFYDFHGRHEQAQALLRKINELKGAPRSYTKRKVRDRVSFEDWNRDLNNDSFYSLLRMDRLAFEALMEIVGGHPALQRDEQMAKRADIIASCPRTIMACTLMYLGGRTPFDVGLHFGLSRQFTSRAVECGIEAILAHKANFIDPDPLSSLAKQKDLAAGFNSKTYKYKDPNTRNVMQGCIGAVDGIVIRVGAPDHARKGRFSNYKGYHALVFQAMCNSEMEFTFFSEAFMGNTNDSSTFNKTELSMWVYGGKDDDGARIDPKIAPAHWIAADGAYSCTDNIITPFTYNTTDIKQIGFNEKLSSLRVRIEMAFGILQSRWRVLSCIKKTDAVRCANVVHACVCLHNHMCKRGTRPLLIAKLQSLRSPETDRRDHIDSTRLSFTDSDGEMVLVRLGDGRKARSNRPRGTRREALTSELSLVYKFDKEKAKAKALKRRAEASALLRERVLAKKQRSAPPNQFSAAQ